MGMTADSRWERSKFSSTDAEETREFLDHVYGWRMGAQRPGRPGRPLTISMVRADALATADAVAPGDLSYEVTGSDFYVFDTLLQGEFELQHSRGTDRHRRGDVFIANHPDADFVASTHDIKVVTTMLPAAVLDEVAHLDPDTEASPVRFDSLTPRAGAAARWRAASRYVDGLLNGAPPSSLLARATARQLAAVALETFPNDALDASSHAAHDGDAHPEALRRAIAFIESNPDVDITLNDIARAACVGPRAVQLAFRRHLDTTPLAYVRRVRLEHAAADLEAAVAGDGTTVTGIAAHWGFHSPSRFAAEYRATYGHPPSHTLRGTHG